MSDESTPETPKKPKKGSLGRGKPAKNLPPQLVEAQKARDKAVKEERIEQIVSIMRQVATKAGKPTWDRKVRKALAASWGVPDYTARSYAAVASKRIMKEMLQSKDVERMAGLATVAALADAYAKKDWKTLTPLLALIQKAMERAAEAPKPVEVDAGPAAAAAAVAEFFGKKAAKSLDVPAPTVEPDPFPSAASAGCSPGDPPAA